eukprot:1956462-Pyramimonas_sp.AAC.2
MAAVGRWLHAALILTSGFGCLAVGVKLGPLEACSSGYQWASSTAVALGRRGAPLNFDSGTKPFLDTIVHAISERAPTITRSAAFVEIYSGTARCTRAVRSLGYRAFSFDVLDRAWQDTRFLKGCLYAMWLLASICAGGTAWFGPQCSTWIPMARGHTKRTDEDPYGNDIRNDVREANWTCLLV